MKLLCLPSFSEQFHHEIGDVLAAQVHALNHVLQRVALVYWHHVGQFFTCDIQYNQLGQVTGILKKISFQE